MGKGRRLEGGVMGREKRDKLNILLNVTNYDASHVPCHKKAVLSFGRFCIPRGNLQHGSEQFAQFESINEDFHCLLTYFSCSATFKGSRQDAEIVAGESTSASSVCRSQ